MQDFRWFTVQKSCWITGIEDQTMTIISADTLEPRPKIVAFNQLVELRTVRKEHRLKEIQYRNVLLLSMPGNYYPSRCQFVFYGFLFFRHPTDHLLKAPIPSIGSLSQSLHNLKFKSELAGFVISQICLPNQSYHQESVI